MNNAAGDTGVTSTCVSPYFQYVGYKPRAETAGSDDNSPLAFRGSLECFPQQLHDFTLPPPMCKGSKVPTRSPTFVIYFITAILMGVKWCRPVILIYTSLASSDVEYLRL